MFEMQKDFFGETYIFIFYSKSELKTDAPYFYKWDTTNSMELEQKVYICVDYYEDFLCDEIAKLNLLISNIYHIVTQIVLTKTKSKTSINTFEDYTEFIKNSNVVSIKIEAIINELKEYI